MGAGKGEGEGRGDWVSEERKRMEEKEGRGEMGRERSGGRGEMGAVKRREGGS